MEANGVQQQEQSRRISEWYINRDMIEMVVLEGKGRSLVAKRDLKEGECILKVYPFIWAPDEHNKKIVCRYCLREQSEDSGEPSPFPIVCQHCQEVHYCSYRCKQRDAPLHQGFECLMLKSWELDPAVYELDVIAEMKLLVRTVCRKSIEKEGPTFGLNFSIPSDDEEPECEENDSSVPEQDENEFEEMEINDKVEETVVLNHTNNEVKQDKQASADMETCNDDEINEENLDIDRSERDIAYSDYLFLISGVKQFQEDMVDGLRYWICSYLSSLGQWIGRKETEDELLDLLIRNRRNSFSVWNDPSMKQRGIAVYVTPSFLNHDCNPNLWLKRDLSSCLRFVTSREVRKGGELSISYIDTTEDVITRRAKLSSNYLFHCTCKRCIEEEITLEKQV